jgi:hypothetical protein
MAPIREGLKRTEEHTKVIKDDIAEIRDDLTMAKEALSTRGC